MWKRVASLFVISNRFEAYLIIYALAYGAMARAQMYLVENPGLDGKLLALACTGAVFMGGAKILDATPKNRVRTRRLALLTRWKDRG